jgi:hypothetical protein
MVAGDTRSVGAMERAHCEVRKSLDLAQTEEKCLLRRLTVLVNGTSARSLRLQRIPLTWR